MTASAELDMAAEPQPPALSYPQLFLRFLRFGLMAWGGPVAQIAMLRKELVEEERWISSARFNRLLAVMQVLPGPEAHELCVHLGMRAKGRLGGMLAGLAFMLPGFLLMFALSWLYFAMDIQSSALGAAFLGVQVGVVATAGGLHPLDAGGEVVHVGVAEHAGQLALGAAAGARRAAAPGWSMRLLLRVGNLWRSCARSSGSP